jgi:hypothetical protein
MLVVVLSLLGFMGSSIIAADAKAKAKSHHAKVHKVHKNKKVHT